MGIGGLIAISFSQQGVFLTKIYEFGLQFIGWPLIFLPFIFIVGGLMLTSAKLAIASPHVLLGSVITMISLAGLSGAGSIGYGIKDSITSLISLPGAILFFLIGTVIGLFVLFETSIEDFIAFVQDSSGKLSGLGTKMKTSICQKPTPFSNKKNSQNNRWRRQHSYSCCPASSF
jgi:hypothetical protein